MATLHLSFDLGSQSVTSATVDGRGLGGPDIVSVVLGPGLAQLLNSRGSNLLEGYANEALDHTKAQLDVAQAFGVKPEALGAEGQGS